MEITRRRLLELLLASAGAEAARRIYVLPPIGGWRAGYSSRFIIGLMMQVINENIENAKDPDNRFDSRFSQASPGVSYQRSKDGLWMAECVQPVKISRNLETSPLFDFSMLL